MISVKDYLESRGVTCEKKGTKYFASSPFSSDSEWSFCIYPDTNSFYDWSTGKGGDIWKLISLLEGVSYKKAKEKYDEHRREKALFGVCETDQGPYTKETTDIRRVAGNSTKIQSFVLTRHTKGASEEQIEAVHRYARSRGIRDGYTVGVTSSKIEGKWQKEAGLGFVHRDQEGKPCGIKIRRLPSGDSSGRFTARGRLGAYILRGGGSNGNTQGAASKETDGHTSGAPRPTSSSKNTQVFLVEGEANANSLWEYLKEINFGPFVVVSGGGVTKPPLLPFELEDLPKKIIIDYDGSEEKYQERIAKYNYTNSTFIKLILPKGEDINSLYVQNKTYLIKQLLIQ